MSGAKHTWEFSTSSRLLHFYEAVWRADPARADFCKLFWAVVLAPVGVLLFVPARWLMIGVVCSADRLFEAVQKRRRPTVAERRAKRATHGFPARVAETFSRPAVRKVGEGLFCATIAAPFVMLLVLYVRACIEDFHQVMFVTGIAFVALVVLGLAGAGLVGLHRLGVLGRVGRGFAAAGRFFADGYRSVKSNTCPRIVIRNDAAERAA